MQHIISQTRNATIIDHNNVTPQSRKSSPPTHRPDSLPTPIHELLSQLEAQAGNAQPSDSQPICEYGLFLRGLQSTGSFPTNYFMLILVGFRGRGRGWGGGLSEGFLRVFSVLGFGLSTTLFLCGVEFIGRFFIDFFLLILVGFRVWGEGFSGGFCRVFFSFSSGFWVLSWRDLAEILAKFCNKFQDQTYHKTWLTPQL
jgi:hypothetical protein